MPERRSVYFAFQGLFAAVLMLIFLYQYRGGEGWLLRFSFLTAAAAASLVGLRLADDRTLGRWWLQVGLFLGDAALASLLLSWTQHQSDYYMIYFLIIFGTAITRNFKQSVVVAGLTSVLYLFAAWNPVQGFPADTAFWLRFLFLVTSASLMAILSLDSQRSQAAQERRYRDRLIQVERLAALGQVAGEVAHQIKGPLTTIMVNADVLAARHAKSKETVKELGEIREEVEHCKKILKNLLDLGRIEEVELSALDLREPLRLAVKSIEPQIRGRGIRWELSGLDQPAPIMGDQSLLQEAIADVLQNAIEASAKGGAVRVALSASSRAPWAAAAPGWRLAVEDDGVGMSEEDLERVFEPFFTTKGEGTGLGLSAALHIMQKHGGSIEASSAGPGKGSRFVLGLPARK